MNDMDRYLYNYKNIKELKPQSQPFSGVKSQKPKESMSIKKSMGEALDLDLFETNTSSRPNNSVNNSSDFKALNDKLDNIEKLLQTITDIMIDKYK